MLYLAHTKGVHIQHGPNNEEKEIGPCKVNGYYETTEGEQIVLEFHENTGMGVLEAWVKLSRILCVT